MMIKTNAGSMDLHIPAMPYENNVLICPKCYFSGKRDM